jgi:hypothetical protein
MKITLSLMKYLEICHHLAYGASVVAANYAASLIGRPYRTRGVYLKALSVVQYDRAYDMAHAIPMKGGAA